VIKAFSAIAFLLLFGCAVSAPKEEETSRVSVSFVEPEKFTDARRAEMAPTTAGVLRELEKFLIETSGRYLPETMKLNIRVTDVDLAGDFELFRGPQADQVRITKGLYPPRIVLEFEIIDGTEAVLRSGKRDLTDINYQLRNVYPREDYLRYEKDILRDWLRAEVGVLNAGKSN
jgi:Protein of unknown function (DUF3016)